MPKRKYPRTDETYDVLRNHVGEIARYYPCDSSYIYAIKNGDSNDVYAQYRHLFNAAAIAGAPVEIWLRDLTGILERIKVGTPQSSELIGKLSEKILADAEETREILDAIEDNEIDKRECHRILAAAEAARGLNSGIIRLLEIRLAEINKDEEIKFSPHARVGADVR